MLKEIGKYFRELTIIVIGVTIALVFENIDNDMKNAERLEKTEATILLELKEHEICLEQIIKEQGILIEKYYSTNDSVTDKNIPIMRLLLPNSAYIMLLNNNTLDKMESSRTTSIMNYYSKVNSTLMLEQNYLSAFNSFIMTGDAELLFFWMIQMKNLEEYLLSDNIGLQVKLK